MDLETFTSATKFCGKLRFKNLGEVTG